MFITIVEEIGIMNEDLLWEKVLKRIENEVTSLVYVTWFKPTRLRKIDNGKVVILVPLEIHKKHLSERYYNMIVDCLSKETDDVNEVLIELEEEFADDEEDLEYAPRHARNCL